jgi:hypothetical protein
MKFDKIWLEFFKIWCNSGQRLLFALGWDQIVKRNLEFQIHEFSWFASRIWFEIICIFTLAYLELDYQRIWFITKTLMKVISKAVTWGVIEMTFL